MKVPNLSKNGHKIDHMIRNAHCDVLALEKGPSCSNIDQVPNLGLIHVRFISHGLVSSQFISAVAGIPVFPPKSKSIGNVAKSEVGHGEMLTQRTLRKQRKMKCHQVWSLSSMLKIGQKISSQKDCTNIRLKTFNISALSWEAIGIVTFNVEKNLLGAGAFRDVYAAGSIDP